MADIEDIEAAQTVKIVGSDSTGVEQTPVESTTDGEFTTVDISNHGGEDAVLNIAAGVTVELKVGGSPRSNRKYIQIQALDNGMKWGFSNVTTSFNAFKNQFFILPFGAGTSVWIKNTGGSAGDIAIAEAS